LSQIPLVPAKAGTQRVLPENRIPPRSKLFVEQFESDIALYFFGELDAKSALK
jgi:hypothetical protein